MGKNIDPRQQAVRDEVKAFAEKHIYPVSEQLDRMGEPRHFPKELYRKLGDAGFIGYVMPPALGGKGKSHLEYITLVEELCYHDAAVGLLCAVGELATHPLINFGSDTLKKKYVAKCAKGEIIPAFVLTEPEAGSDAANQKTEAVESGGGFVLNGEKIFIMHGDVADIGVVFCKIKDQPKLSAIVVETNQPGWQAIGRAHV